MDGSFPRMDMSGKLIIKVQLGDDIRCIPIHNEDITYDELVLMMQRVFHGKLSSHDEVTIKYKDEDGDLVTIFDSSDLSFAIHCSKVLKITLFVNGQPKPLETDEIKQIRSSLQDIRNRVNYLLDSLDPLTRGLQTSGDDLAADKEARPPSVQPHVGSAGSGKEFDPLSTQKGVLKDGGQPPRPASSVDAGGQSGRANTPDSISSVGSASDRSQRQPQSQPPTPGGYRQQHTPVHQQGYGQQGQHQQQAVYAEQNAQAYSGPQSLPAQPAQGRYAQPQPVRPGFNQPPPGHQQQQQPVPAGYAQQQPVQTGYGGQQAYGGQNGQPGGVAGQFVGGGAQQIPAANQQQQQQVYQPQAGYPTQGYGGQVQPGGPQSQQPQQGAFTPTPAHGPQGQGNPYSRTPSYSTYPRPQGQYPQAP